MTAVLANAPAPADVLGLDPDQVQAAILLASGMGVKKVAKELGIDRKTIWRWREQPAFAAAFERELAVQTQLMREATHARLLSMTEEALDVVEAAMKAGGLQALAAARIVLSRAGMPEPKALPNADELARRADGSRAGKPDERSVAEMLEIARAARARQLGERA